ncbi:hypothetical protein D3C73_1167260 [compost metagenome]
MGLRWHGQRCAGQCQPGRGHQHVAGRRRQLLDHLPERDQRRGRPRHHRGGRCRQQQHQRLQRGTGELPERDRRGGHHLGGCACQLLQLRHRHRHLRTGPEHPVHPQQRHHHPGQRQLRILQRHLDGRAACGGRGCTDAVGGTEPAQPGASGEHHQEHRASAAGCVLGWLRRRHHRRRCRSDSCDQRHHAQPGWHRAAEQRAGHRPRRGQRRIAQLHRQRPGWQRAAARGDQRRQR